MSYLDAVNEATDVLLSEDVHDYLRKLAKKGIQKIGTADFKSVLAKYGDKKEKEIFATQDYSGKSIDIKSLFGGLSRGIGERVTAERKAHPYEIHKRSSWDSSFPEKLGYTTPPKGDESRTPEQKERVSAKLVHRRNRELTTINQGPERKLLNHIDGRLSAIATKVNRHYDVMDQIEDSILEPVREQKRQAYDKLMPIRRDMVRPHEAALSQARRAKESETYTFRYTPEHKLLDPKEYDSRLLALYKKHDNIITQHETNLQAAEAEFTKKHDEIMAPHNAALKQAHKVVDAKRVAYSEKHLISLYNERADLFRDQDNALEILGNKKEAIHSKYDNLQVALRGNKTSLPLTNYAEHVAQSNLPRPEQTRHGKPYSGGHWSGLSGTTEFNAITSDLDHPTLGKTLFVHELQSDLQQKTKNDSPIGKTWHEHALSHVKNIAHEGGYEHVMFAPSSVQYVNNGGHAKAEEVRTALDRATADQRGEIHRESGTLDPEALAGVMRGQAGDLAKRYHSEIFPTANKVFGHEPELHSMHYNRQRGRGEEEVHHFPVYKVEKNIAAMEESFQAYMKNKTLVENVTNKLLGAE